MKKIAANGDDLCLRNAPLLKYGGAELLSIAGRKARRSAALLTLRLLYLVLHCIAEHAATDYAGHRR